MTGSEDDDWQPSNIYEQLREIVGAPRLVKIYEGPYPGPELDPRDWRVYRGEWADVT